MIDRLSLTRRSALAAATLLLAACGGYSGAPDGTSSGNGGTSSFSTPQAFAAERVTPNLGFCRSCHVPGGVADTDAGRRMMLSSQSSEDYLNLSNSWSRLGRGVESNLILLNASGEHVHSGGAPWPRGSASYKDMQTLLACWDDPASCTSLLANVGSGGTTSSAYPLLGEGHHGGHAWSRYCEGLDDGALLPVNPVTLVKPGVNEGRAVYFNAYYKNCHVDAAPADAAPKTCGDWRARIERGGLLMRGDGEQGAAANFVGNFPGSSLLPGFAITTDAYNNIWQTWGLQARPENFDQLLAARWGVVIGPKRNPYPLPGEDPNQTDGGSGQLPTALTQMREADGRWSGKLATNCHACHSGQIGVAGEAGLPGPVYGTNSLSDIGVMGRDLMFAGYSVGPALTAFTQVRGLGNITNFQVFNAISLLQDPANLVPYLLEQTSGGTGSEDPPVWWNFGHRPLKFFDGGMSSDSQRILLSAFTPLGASNPYPLNVNAAFDWIELHDQDAAAWILNLKAPKYPEPVDTALAEQGAVLFHAKDLFADPANAGRERPRGGNGSCASCHGAYSPRYVHDPAYLENAALEGVAGYIVPRDLIGTDPRRVDGNDQEVAQTFESDWFGYPEQRGTDNDCGDQNLDRIRGDRANGYLAPPLYGVWASAPYFHNGSVPSVWEVLKSTDRKLFWRRVSTPDSSNSGMVTSFDPSFQRAYDSGHLGWKYDEIQCGVVGLTPYIECEPSDPTSNPLLQQMLSVIYANGGLAWNIPNLLMTPLSNAQIEERKIYNTRLYSQDNGGHAFTDVLNDGERRALIEYLKTL